jgi:hypothetical protein
LVAARIVPGYCGAAGPLSQWHACPTLLAHVCACLLLLCSCVYVRPVNSAPRVIWQYAMKPAGRCIAATWHLVWKHVLAPPGRCIAATCRLLWLHVLLPMGRCIATTFRGLWKYVLKPIGAGIFGIPHAIAAVIIAVSAAMVACLFICSGPSLAVGGGGRC